MISHPLARTPKSRSIILILESKKNEDVYGININKNDYYNLEKTCQIPSEQQFHDTFKNNIVLPAL